MREPGGRDRVSGGESEEWVRDEIARLIVAMLEEWKSGGRRGNICEEIVLRVTEEWGEDQGREVAGRLSLGLLAKMPAERADLVLELADHFIRDNPTAATTVSALRGQGRSDKWVRDEIARLLLVRLQLAAAGAPPPDMASLLARLRAGETAAQMFPE